MRHCCATMRTLALIYEEARQAERQGFPWLALFFGDACVALRFALRISRYTRCSIHRHLHRSTKSVPGLHQRNPGTLFVYPYSSFLAIMTIIASNSMIFAMNASENSIVSECSRTVFTRTGIPCSRNSAMRSRILLSVCTLYILQSLGTPPMQNC